MTLPERRALHLTIFDDAAGGLNFLLADGRSLALHERLALAGAGTRPWQGDAWRHAAAGPGGLLHFGRALAAALLPASVRAVLARQRGGWLHLKLGQRQLAVPWELAALPAHANSPGRYPDQHPDERQYEHQDEQPDQHLDERFTTVRQILCGGMPPAALPHGDPGALLQVLHGMGTGPAEREPRTADAPQPGRFGPLLRRVHWRNPAASADWQHAAGLADIVHLHLPLTPDRKSVV